MTKYSATVLKDVNPRNEHRPQRGDIRHTAQQVIVDASTIGEAFYLVAEKFIGQEARITSVEELPQPLDTSVGKLHEVLENADGLDPEDWTDATGEKLYFDPELTIFVVKSVIDAFSNTGYVNDLFVTVDDSPDDLYFDFAVSGPVFESTRTVSLRDKDLIDRSRNGFDLVVDLAQTIAQRVQELI